MRTPQDPNIPISKQYDQVTREGAEEPANEMMAKPTLEQLVEEFGPYIGQEAKKAVFDYRRWIREPYEEAKDLTSIGMLTLIDDLYNRNRIDFDEAGWRTYVKKCIWGKIRNAAHNYPRVVYLEPGQTEDDDNEGTWQNLEKLLEEILRPSPENIEEYIFKKQVMEAIYDFLSRCQARERFILVSTYLDGATQDTIAQCLGKHRTVIAKDIKRLTKKLRVFLIKRFGPSLLLLGL